MGTVLRDVEEEFGPGPTRLHLVASLTSEMPPAGHVATAHCLAFDGDRIVLARHVDREWTIPGGHLEPGESVEEALRREALEEAGIEIGTPTLVAVERCDRVSGPPLSDRYTNPSYQTFFVAPLVSLGTPTALDECTESRLFSPEEARVAPGWVQDVPALYEAALAWALDHLCAGCGFVYDESVFADAAAAIRGGVDELVRALRSMASGNAAAARPSPDVWSPVEYACHLRDVLLVQRERAILALVASAPPSLAPMSREERVAIEVYGATAVHDIARQLTDATALFTNVLDRLDDAGWSRTLLYNYPVLRERSLRWLAVHTLHEVRHHLADVRRSA